MSTTMGSFHSSRWPNACSSASLVSSPRVPTAPRIAPSRAYTTNCRERLRLWGIRSAARAPPAAASQTASAQAIRTRILSK